MKPKKKKKQAITSYPHGGVPLETKKDKKNLLPELTYNTMLSNYNYNIPQMDEGGVIGGKSTEGGKGENGSSDTSNIQSLPWAAAGDFTSDAIGSVIPEKVMSGGQTYTSMGEGISTGAVKGAALGTAFAPGIGTAIGAVVGGIGGFFKSKKGREKAFEYTSNIEPNYSANPYGTPIAEDGMLVNSPLINIEKGELSVDPTSGDILDDYDSPAYRAHSREKTKEWKHNFIVAQPGSLIIPKKYRSTYINNIDQRQGIIRDILNKQLDRELFGKDADGNVQTYTDLGDEGIAQYLYGGNVPKMQYGGVHGGLDDIERDLRSFNPTGENPPSYYENKYGIDSNLESVTNLDNYLGESTLPSSSSYINPLTGTEPKEDANFWTTGNTVGLASLGVGALGPLTATLAGRQDKEEINPYLGVANRSINMIGDTYQRGKENIMKRISRNANAALEMNRNRTSNFASVLSTATNILAGTNQAQSNAALQYDIQEAREKSRLRFQGDIYEARGRDVKLERLKQNKDNYFSNLSDNASNASNNGMMAALLLNQNEQNRVAFNTLPQFNFKVNPDGTYDFLPGKLTSYEDLYKKKTE